MEYTMSKDFVKFLLVDDLEENLLALQHSCSMTICSFSKQLRPRGPGVDARP